VASGIVGVVIDIGIIVVVVIGIIVIIVVIVIVGGGGICYCCQMRTSKYTCLIFGVKIDLDPG